ncbi:MAG TPA: hydrogenase maturation protease [Syntrophales bacterium]|nr:hydrogenase maturation protease [Syntrophales bacterium]
MADKHFVTLLGLGNILMKDEGFGVHFIRWLGDRWRFPETVGLVEGGVMAYALLGTVCGCERLIVIDVLKTDDEPGAVYRFTLAEIEPKLPPPTSAHEVQFLDVLCKAEMLDEAPEVIFLCIVPEDFHDMDMEMSPLMREKFPFVEELLMKELARHGIRPERCHA